jgi:hypothetical protein
MEHRVCTDFGFLDKPYGSTDEKLLYAIVQGSCVSPILWALINRLLLEALGENFTCIRLVVIDSEEEHIRPGNTFVDDIMTGSTKDNSELELVSDDISDLTSSKEMLIAKMKDIIVFFLDLLQVTGGDLIPKNACGIVKLLPLPQPPLRACTDARTNPSAQRATQLRSVLARVYAVARQNQTTTAVP